MIEPTIPELLMDLTTDSEHAAAADNLEACYLEPLERLTTDPALLDAVIEVRRCLAQTHLAMRRLAMVKVGQ